jgi:hypothetical protein
VLVKFLGKLPKGSLRTVLTGMIETPFQERFLLITAVFPEIISFVRNGIT